LGNTDNSDEDVNRLVMLGMWGRGRDFLIVMWSLWCQCSIVSVEHALCSLENCVRLN